MICHWQDLTGSERAPPSRAQGPKVAVTPFPNVEIHGFDRRSSVAARFSEREADVEQTVRIAAGELSLCDRGLDVDGGILIVGGRRGNVARRSRSRWLKPRSGA